MHGERRVLRHLVIDFNSYFASVEQQLRPELRGRPVGVVPMLADSTCLIAASYECKRHGVKTLTRVRDAKRIIPDIVLVQARHAEYVKFHERAVKVVDSLLPIEKVMSIDEMACELPPRFSEPDAARAKAQEVKDAICAELGECLKTSVGIAPNIFLAKQASNMQKPDGLTVLTLDDLPHKLYVLQLGDLTGIGPRMLKRLNAQGIHTIEQLWALNRDQLRTIWGGVGGEDFYDRLRGAEIEWVHEGGKSISHSHVLPPDQRTLASSYAILDRLTQKAAMRLRKAGQVTGSMAIVVKAARHYRDAASNMRWEAAARFTETQDSHLLVRHLAALWKQVERQARQQARGRGAVPYQVAVVFGELLPLSQQTPDLFDSAAVQDKRARPKEKLNQAVDALNVRYGKHTVYFGAAHEARGHGGMAIAFNHIPDLETEA
jgi:DNA polymerase-4